MGEVYKARDTRLEPPMDLFVNWTALLKKN
jgi:hypothetical protein